VPYSQKSAIKNKKIERGKTALNARYIGGAGGKNPCQQLHKSVIKITTFCKNRSFLLPD
jgi:hypothetical protein